MLVEVFSAHFGEVTVTIDTAGNVQIRTYDQMGVVELTEEDMDLVVSLVTQFRRDQRKAKA